MAKKEAWEPCPRCGSNRVRVDGIGTFLLIIGVLLFLLGLALIFISIVGVILMFSGFVFSIYGIIKKRKNKYLLRCADCHNAWKYPAAKTDQNQPE